MAAMLKCSCLWRVFASGLIRPIRSHPKISRYLTTRVYKGSQGYTGVCKGLQGYTGVYKGILPGYTGVYMGIQGFIRVYKGLLWCTGVCKGLQGSITSHSLALLWDIWMTIWLEDLWWPTMNYTPRYPRQPSPQVTLAYKKL